MLKLGHRTLLLALLVPSMGLATPSDTERIQRWIEVLGDESAFKVRLQAAILLGRTRDDRAFDPLVKVLQEDPHYTVRSAAAMALANLGEPRAISHILRRLAVDADPFVREEARRSLETFSREEALPYVVAVYNADDARVRRAAVEFLAQEPGPAAKPVLARALGDTPDILTIAQRAILAMSKVEAVEFLQGALAMREAPIRRGAVSALRAVGTKEATAAVLEVYERDIEVEEVRAAARDALREHRRHLPLDDIIRDAMSSPEKHTRAKSLKLLGVVGGERAEEVLLQALKDDDIYVRGNAVMALRELDDPQVVAALQSLINDPANQRIVHLVQHALKHLQRQRGER